MRILIAHASRRGGTAGLAAMIGDAFADQGWQVDVQRACDVHRVDDFDAVAVVSGVYMGRWLRDARRFVKRFADSLRERHVWLVSSGPLSSDFDASAPAPRSVRRLMRETGAKSHVTFGGYLASGARGFPASSMAKTRAGDYRDPQQIRTWVTAALSEYSAPNL